MTRLGALSVGLLVLLGCGGGGSSAPSVKSDRDEIQRRRDEIRALCDDPSAASKEVPELLKAMADPDPEVRWRSEFALGRVDARGLRALSDALHDGTPPIRVAAAQVLGPRGKQAESAVPALLAALSDPEPGVRVWAAKALGDIDAETPEVFAAYLRTLRDPSPDVRRVTLYILIRRGPAVSGSAQVLTDVLEDADAGIRALACSALRRLGSDEKAGISPLIARLSDPDSVVRASAAQALAAIGTAGLPALVRALKERDPRTRRAAANIIAALGPDAKSAAVELAEAAKDEDAAVQRAAAEAVRKVQAETGEAGMSAGPAFLEAPETIARRAAGLKWAKFGLFFHWGLYAVPARAKPGQSAEALMENERMPVREYEHFALSFDAGKFKPDEWVKLASEAGARYVVLTAKTSDGFCLWNTKLTEYSSTRLAVSKRDLLGDLAAACDKEGLKFCASYSLRDLHHPDYEANFSRYLEYAQGQVKELLSGYPLWGLWLDGDLDHTRLEWHSQDLVAMVRRIRPQAFVNDRLGRDARGTATGVDFYTDFPNATPAALRLEGRPTAWVAREPLGTSRGFTQTPDPLKSSERIILDLAEAASKGGNFLLSVAVRADGTIPEAHQARLRTIGSWLQKNGESIFDTERSPFGGPIPAGRVTAKGSRLYVFLEKLPESGTIALPGLKTKVREAWVVDGKKELSVRDTGVAAPGDLVEGSPLTVVGIELEGAPEVSR